MKLLLATTLLVLAGHAVAVAADAHYQRNLLAAAYGSGEATGSGESNGGSAVLDLSSGASSGAADTGDTMTASSTGGGTIYVDADVEVAMASGDAAADALFANVGAAEIMSEANANGEDYASAFAGANVAIFEEEEEEDEGIYGTSFAQGIADAIASGNSNVDTEVVGGANIELEVEDFLTIGYTEAGAEAMTDGDVYGEYGSSSVSELYIGAEGEVLLLDEETFGGTGAFVDSAATVTGGTLALVEGDGVAETDIEAAGQTYSYTGHAGVGVGGNLEGQGDAAGTGEASFIGGGVSYGADEGTRASLASTDLEAISGSETKTSFGVEVIDPYRPVVYFDGATESVAYGGGMAVGSANGNVEAGFDAVVFGKTYAEADMLQELFGLSVVEEEASSLIEADTSAMGRGYSSGGAEGVSASEAGAYSSPYLIKENTRAAGSGASVGEGYATAGSVISHGYTESDAVTLGSGSGIAGSIYIGEGGSGGAVEAEGANDFAASAHGAGYGYSDAGASGLAGTSVEADVARLPDFVGIEAVYSNVDNTLMASSMAYGDYTETGAVGNDFGASGAILASEAARYGEATLGVTTTEGYTETSVDNEALGNFYGIAGSNVYIDSDTTSTATAPIWPGLPTSSDTTTGVEAGASGLGLKVYSDGEITTGSLSDTLGGGGAGFEGHLGHPYPIFETAAIGAGLGDAAGAGYATVTAHSDEVYPDAELRGSVAIGAASEAGSYLDTKTDIAVAGDNTGSLSNTVTETGVGGYGAGATYAATTGDYTGAATLVDGSGKLAFEQGSGSYGEDRFAYALSLALADLDGESEGTAQAYASGEDASLEAEATGSAAGGLYTDSLVDAFDDPTMLEDIIAANAQGGANFVATGYADTSGEETYVETAAESGGMIEGAALSNVVSTLPPPLQPFSAIGAVTGFESEADIAVSNFGEGADSGAVSIADASVGGESWNLIGALVGLSQGSENVHAVTAGATDVVADYGEVDGAATSHSDSWIIDSGQTYKDFAITCNGEEECSRINGGFVATTGVGIGAAEADADAYETLGGTDVAQSQSYGYGLGATIGAAIAVDGSELAGGFSGGLGQGVGVGLAESLENMELLSVSVADTMGGASVFGIDVGSGEAGSVAEGYGDAYGHAEAGDDYVEANTAAEGYGFSTTFVNALDFGAEKFAGGEGESSGYASIDSYDDIYVDTYADSGALLTPTFDPYP
jgi:hypothetical protein